MTCIGGGKVPFGRRRAAGACQRLRLDEALLEQIPPLAGPEYELFGPGKGRE